MVYIACNVPAIGTVDGPRIVELKKISSHQGVGITGGYTDTRILGNKVPFANRHPCKEPMAEPRARASYEEVTSHTRAQYHQTRNQTIERHTSHLSTWRDGMPQKGA